VTTFINDIYLYVPRHSRLTFVEELDYLSGLGHNPARTLGDGPQYLISDLGQFDFKGTSPTGSPRIRLISYHPGVEIARIQARTGFDLEVAPDVHETLPPDENELYLLREEIDPLGIRRLESLSGSARRQLMLEIIAKEKSDQR